MSARPKEGVDWESIERSVRAGLLSYREMGKLHGVNGATILKRAARLEWRRDLSGKIQAEAEAIVNAITVSAANGNANGNTAMGNTQQGAATKGNVGGVPEQQVVATNASVVADVRLRHRGDIARLRAVSMAMLAETETLALNQEALQEVADVLNSANDVPLQKLVEVVQRVAGLKGRVEVVDRLANALRVAVSMEREAWGMDKVVEAPPQTALSTWIQSMQAQPLQVVKEVPRDE